MAKKEYEKPEIIITKVVPTPIVIECICKGGVPHTTKNSSSMPD